MNKSLGYFLCILFVSLLASESFCIGEGAVSEKLKFIDSCELDLNNDGLYDIVFLMDTINGRELIILFRIINGYNVALSSKVHSNMLLSCHFGKYIEETSAGKGKKRGKIYETNGSYIKLNQPEASSVVYFWNGNKFQEIWTSD